MKLTWPFVLGLMAVEAASLALALGLFWFVTQRIQTGPADASAQIRKLSDEQAAAWNRGDLEGFMAGYWNDERLAFYSGGDITTGWQPTLDRYRKRYQGEGKAMGKLAFTGLDISMLSDDAATASGHWRVDMPDGKVLEGLFTLVLRKFGNDWRIVRDHTSLKSPPDKP